MNDGPQQPQGPEVGPGRYTVTVTVGGQSATTTVDVIADPRKDVEFFNTPAPGR